MMNARNYRPRQRFPVRTDPVMVAMLFGGVLLGCGILIGHLATVALR